MLAALQKAIMDNEIMKADDDNDINNIDSSGYGSENRETNYDKSQ